MLRNLPFSCSGSDSFLVSYRTLGSFTRKSRIGSRIGCAKATFRDCLTRAVGRDTQPQRSRHSAEHNRRPLPLLHRSQASPRRRSSPSQPHSHSVQSPQQRGRSMGRSAKVARIGNFATHKKNVQKRSLVVEKRPKKSRQTYATSKAPARAPKKAVRDAPKKK